MDLTVHASQRAVMRLHAVYRPPPSSKNTLTYRLFVNEFSSLLELVTVNDNAQLLVGDFNIHVDDIRNKDAMNFVEMLESAGLQQHVTVATHQAGHILDLIISRKIDNLVNSVDKVSGLPSDHHALICPLNLGRPPPEKKLITCRKLRNINLNILREDIKGGSLCSLSTRCPSEAVEEYNTTLRQLLDKHAPVQSHLVSLRPHAPWYTESVKESKRLRRRAERKMIKSNIEINRQLYKQQCEAYNLILDGARTEYMTTEIKECDTKQLFKLVSKLTIPKTDSVFPDRSSDEELANDFGEFFLDKIRKIVTTFPPSNLPDETLSCDCEFQQFEPVTQTQVRKLIKNSVSKSCRLDPMPTHLVKSCLDELVPSITHIMNSSLSSGTVPELFKTSHVVPLLKKSDLNPDDFKSYRPIANLPFLAKILEKIVASQLRVYLDKQKLFPEMQSAYRQFHSTETALIRVFNDVLLAVDKGHEAVLVLLDYTAAFDSIDHTTMIDRFLRGYGIKGCALKWLESYLDNRKQHIVVNDSISRPFPLPWGVPQGSVLGPLEFILYTGPLSAVISSHRDIHHVMYADDTQLYVTMTSKDQT